MKNGRMKIEKRLAGGLLGPVMRIAVSNPAFKELSKKIVKTANKVYKGKDQALKKQDIKIQKGKAVQKAMSNIVKSKEFGKTAQESCKKALEKIKEYNKLKGREALEYIKSKGKVKN